MIITRSDLEAVDQLLQRLHEESRLDAMEQSGNSALDHFADVQYDTFFAHRPHLLLPLGFDEYRAFDRRDKSDDSRDDLDLMIEEAVGVGDLYLAFDYESIFRDVKSGAWHWFEGIDEKRLNFWGPSKTGSNAQKISTDKWLNLLRQAKETPDELPHRLWFPGSRGLSKGNFGETITEVLRGICEEKTAIRDVPPRQLEELVAELLRARGLEIHLTPFSCDGGRDIVARGELIPGEPMLLAVEVKQKPVVGIGDVQRALRANEDFPALLVATAGRFSAGVVREKTRDRNEVRLFLKDGVALSQWISAYGRTRGWR